MGPDPPVLNKYGVNELDFEQIELPTVTPRLVELPPAKTVLNIIKGTDIELPVLLAAWLSFSMSEVRGLTKSKSISGNYITIHEVVVDINNKPVRKELAKNPTRNRRLQIPPYIQNLIDQIDGDVLVPMSGRALYHRWIKLQHDHGLSPINIPMTFGISTPLSWLCFGFRTNMLRSAVDGKPMR
mgnify:CR=1 FL=1